jgi:TonB family protein
MKFLVLAALVLLPGFAFGQKPVKKINKIDPFTKEKYYVLSKEDSTRQGTYEKRWRGNLEVKGQYQAGKKVGAWEFYSRKEKLAQRYNFSTKKIEFQEKSDFFEEANLVLDGVNSSKKPDIPPAFIGGRLRLSRLISRNLRFPASALRNGIQGKVLIGGTITKGGQMKDVAVVQGLGQGLDEESLRVVNLLPADWIPATVNGELVETRIVLPVVYQIR